MVFENAFGAEFRELGEREFKGKPARVVTSSRIYESTQNDLWNAITNKNRLSHWFAPVEGTLEPGGQYKIKGNAKGKILWCEPQNGFDLTWVFFFNTSWVNVRLKAEDKGTRLTLEHIMNKSRMSERHWKKFGPGATGVGWDLWFFALGAHIETGENIDRSEHDAWLKTAEGKTFLRACAVSWGESHIAAGEAAGTATMMANATAKAYAGS